MVAAYHFTFQIRETMSAETGISWCDSTINFWHGCQKVSEGCKFCYMFRDKEMHKQDPRVLMKTKDGYLRSQFKKINERGPSTIFTCSWSDFFIEGADEWRQAAWSTIWQHPQHLFLILTKRIERVEECMMDTNVAFMNSFPNASGELLTMEAKSFPQNIMLGISAENDELFWQRWNVLERIARTYNVKTFISFEPLLGPIKNLERAYESFDLKDDPDEPMMSRIPDWTIVGGESGNEKGPYQYRPCKQEWIQDIVDVCGWAHVPVFVKQLGTYMSNHLNLKSRHGQDLNEFPGSIRFQEFPKFKPFKQ